MNLVTLEREAGQKSIRDALLRSNKRLSEVVAIREKDPSALPAALGGLRRNALAVRTAMHFDRELMALRTAQGISVRQGAAVLTGAGFSGFAA